MAGRSRLMARAEQVSALKELSRSEIRVLECRAPLRVVLGVPIAGSRTANKRSASSLKVIAANVRRADGPLRPPVRF